MKQLRTGVYFTDQQSQALEIVNRAIELSLLVQLFYDPNEEEGRAFQVVCAGVLWWPAEPAAGGA